MNYMLKWFQNLFKSKEGLIPLQVNGRLIGYVDPTEWNNLNGAKVVVIPNRIINIVKG